MIRVCLPTFSLTNKEKLSKSSPAEVVATEAARRFSPYPTTVYSAVARFSLRVATIHLRIIPSPVPRPGQSNTLSGGQVYTLRTCDRFEVPRRLNYNFTQRIIAQRSGATKEISFCTGVRQEPIGGNTNKQKHYP